MPRILLSARDIALDFLHAVLNDRQPLDDVLNDNANLARLSVRDRAFTRHIVATTLRRLGQIDDVIDGCLERPLPNSAHPARLLLRAGIAQLLFLGTPPHAAVATTVEIANRRAPRHKNLINAILRRLGREGRERLARQDAARLNTPDWLWRSWSAAYGEGRAREIAEVHLREPPLDLTVKSNPGTWAARLDAVVLPTGSVRRAGGGNVAGLPGYAEGAWWVQDAAAALPARLLGDVRGHTVVDLCAAPGGKTAQLAHAGARVVAVERSAARLTRLQENLSRLGLVAECVEANVETWRPPAPADAVLLDAPCSATGTIRRHPDVAHLKSPGDVAKLSAIQVRLIEAALDMVRPGGFVVYCACSLEPEEGPDHARRVVGTGQAERISIRPDEVGGLSELIDPNGDLRTLPCHLADMGGLDGFYALRLRRH